MKIDEVIQTYARALRDNDYEAIVNLFAEDAMVFSFQAGIQPPSIFFQRLFETTSRSAVEVKTIFFNGDKNEAAIHINLIALLDKQHPIDIEVVDIFEFDSKNKIKVLKIILDTYPIRALKEKITSQQQAAVTSSQEKSGRATTITRSSSTTTKTRIISKVNDRQCSRD